MSYGYALISKIDIQEEFRKKQLVLLSSDKVRNAPLYWHFWEMQSKAYQKLNQSLIRYLRDRLKKQ